MRMRHANVLRAQHKTKRDRIFYYKIDYAKDESSSLTSYFAKTSRWFVRGPSLSSDFFVILAISIKLSVDCAKNSNRIFNLIKQKDIKI